MRLEVCCHVENHRGARGIVHCSVVDAVAVDGSADADVIDVSGEYNEFIFERRIVAGQLGDDVVGGDVLRRNRSGGLEGSFKAEMGKRLAIFGESGQIRKGVAGAGEEGFGGSRIENDPDIESLSLIEFGVGKVHGRLVVVGRNAGPWDVHGSGIGDGDQADSTRFAKRSPAFPDGLVMRRERARNVGGRTSEVDGNFAVQVEPREFVEAFFRDLKAVADKDKGSGNRGRDVSQAGAEVGVAREGEMFGLGPIDKLEGRLGFVDLVLAEADGLVKPVSSGGLAACLLELLDGIGLGFAQTFTAGVAPFERVVGKRFDMRPPGTAVEVGGEGLLSGCGGDDSEKQKSDEAFRHSKRSGNGLKKMRIAGSGGRVTDNEQTKERNGSGPLRLLTLV